MSDQTFRILLLIARPAAGKSEVINYLKNTPVDERVKRFHIGPFSEIDDFPMLWAWFEEDALLERMGHPRLHTDAEGYFSEPYLWDLLVERICLEYQKRQRDDLNETVVIEFSRGSEHGGYQRAFAHLSDEVLANLAILYLNVPWEESLRKNRARFNPERPDSILEHGLPDSKLEKLYRETDWEQLTEGHPEKLPIKGFEVPYSVFENGDDVTTAQGAALGERLEATLKTLWQRYKS
ncbi:hypothetical protein JR338_13105 (plasmid) [Chloroflexota bacterium]|nr:hypothetical protein JR338_13105 [Chloroflexota bacterium]